MIAPNSLPTACNTFGRSQASHTWGQRGDAMGGHVQFRGRCPLPLSSPAGRCRRAMRVSPPTPVALAVVRVPTDLCRLFSERGRRDKRQLEFPRAKDPLRLYGDMPPRHEKQGIRGTRGLGSPLGARCPERIRHESNEESLAGRHWCAADSRRTGACERGRRSSLGHASQLRPGIRITAAYAAACSSGTPIPDAPNATRHEVQHGRIG